MTRQEAIDTASAARGRFGKKFVVYRLPAWPADVFGCIAFGPLDKGLPPEAQRFEEFEPEKPGKAPKSDAQRTLF